MGGTNKDWRTARGRGGASAGVLALSVVTGAVMLTGCHIAGCREGDQACLMLGDESTTRGTSTGDDTTSEPPVSSSSSETIEPTTMPETDDPPAVCGDGVVAGDEPCDDGNDSLADACLPGCVLARCGDGHTQVGVEQCDDGNEENSDGCSNACQLPRCGDGIVQPPLETCDDGALNSDTLYGGCSKACVPGAGCGDGKVNGPEDCDDGNEDPSDGCLASCIEATSCLQILEKTPGVASGPYRIWPTALGGNIDYVVYCDMESDGGGYTFLKVDTELPNVSDKGAVAAEALCKSFGMHLLVPRTPTHVKSAYAVATGDNVSPVGGGKVKLGAEYLAILAIYAGFPGATCEGKGLNSVDCPMWRAWDDNRFWVTDKPVLDEPSNEHCANCSMFYKWNLDGTLKSYTTFPVGEGASSYRFMCDVADKF